MNKTQQQDTITMRLINTALSSSDTSISIPFDCILKYPNQKNVFISFCNILEKTRDPAIRIRVSRLFQEFAVKKAPELINKNDFDDDFILNCILCVFKSTPPLCSQKDCEVFAKFVQEMIKLIKNIKIPILFNHFVRSSTPFASLAIVILTKNQQVLFSSTIKFIIAMLSQNFEILNIVACALFFSENKFDSLPDAAKKEFNSENASNVLQQAIVNAMGQKINFRIAAVELSHSLFHFYTVKDADKLLKIVLPLFIPQFKENSVQLRTSIVMALSDFPNVEDSKLLISTILPPIASKFDEVDDDFAVAVFTLLNHFKSSSFMKPAIMNLINKDYYVSGVIFAAYLGYFDDDQQLRLRCFPLKPKQNEATAAVMAANSLGIYKLFNKKNFKDIFMTLMTVLTTPELLDDFFLQIRAFKATDSIVQCANQFPYVVSCVLFEYLPVLKGDDVLSHVAPIVDAVSNSEEIASLNSEDFAQIFVSLMIKYIDDPSICNLILPFLLLISPNKEKIHARTDMFLCELFDYLVPSSYVDAVRTEAILKSQNSPRAALIAVALPNCVPFLPTLSRVVRELYPEDTDLTLQFLLNGSKRALESFLPHLMRFTDPVEITNSYFIPLISFKGKKRLHLVEVFKCLTYISRELSPSPSMLNTMLQISEAAFPKDSKIDTVAEYALSTFIELSKVKMDPKTDQTWPLTLLKKIFGFSVFAPCFNLLFSHCPPNIELLSIVVDSYVSYISKLNDNSLNINVKSLNNSFAVSFLKCSPTSEALGKVLKAVFKYIDSAEDSSILLEFCLATCRTFRDSKDDIPQDMFDSIVYLSKFVLSNSDKLRVLAKNILVAIYSIKLPLSLDSQSLPSSSSSNVQSDLPIPSLSHVTFNDDDSLAPFSVIEYASHLFTQVFEKFSEDDIVDFAMYVINSRPFNFTNALLINILVELHPKTLVITPKKFLIQFFDVAEQTTKEARVLMHKISKIMAKVEMTSFLKILTEQTKTNFLSEIVTTFVDNEDFREVFYNNFDEIAKNAKLPISLSEQMPFLTQNFMQYIPVIVQAENNLCTNSLKSISMYLIIWVSMLFGANQSLKLQKSTKEMTSCFDDLFIKLAKCDHDPIEFSLVSAQTLYQSFGTLVNALLLTSTDTIITFCQSLFFLLQSSNQSMVLASALCICRLFHKLTHFSNHILINKLKKSVALSFVNCCDENCRFLAAVMNDIFNRSIFESFDEEDSASILNGAIRGVTYPGPDMKNESLAFLCKITVVFDKGIIETQIDKIWQIINEQDFAPLILTAINSLLQIDNSIQRLRGKITIDKLITVSVGDPSNILTKKSLTVLETITDSQDIKLILKKLKNILQKADFDEMCYKIIDRTNRSNITDNILQLLLELNSIEDESTKFKEKLIMLLLSVVEDSDNPLRSAASENLTKLLT